MATVSDRNLGDLLVENGVITPLELDEALQRQKLQPDMLGRLLVTMGLCDQQDIVEALAIQQGMDRIDITKLSVPEPVLRKVPAHIAEFYSCVPVREKDGVLILAMADPLNISHLDDLRQIVGQEIRPGVSNHADIAKFIKDNYMEGSDSLKDTLSALIDRVGDAALTAEEMGQQEVIADERNLVQLSQEPEIIMIVNVVLLDALKKRASDVHFEVYEDEFRIRVRVDGVLQEITTPPKNKSVAIISRVKVMSEMDIGERRLPQDARIEIKIGESHLDIRVSTLPTLYGENCVMRILDRESAMVDMEKLGLEDNVKKSVNVVIHKPNGIFLVTGPTGSGKTTTLYSCLNVLNQVGVKIITTEDPVEIQIDGVIQAQVREEVGLTFAACLRSILRQDPDIVMVGEIRDFETAQIAVEASLTGHLVLSTLHTNSAPETITRLLDMDLEPFMITASLEAVLAQRLVRRVCRHCREKYRPDEDEMDKLGLPPAWRKDPNLTFFRPAGCPSCDFNGYQGRVGLFEYLKVDDTLRDLINGRAMNHEIRRYARQHLGMLTLREQGLIKCAHGVTTPDEILTHTEAFDA
jgi:type IV pilus assembly protein PilB